MKNRFTVALFTCGLLWFHAGTTELSAQPLANTAQLTESPDVMPVPQAPVVYVVNNMSFGSMPRLSSFTIHYLDPEAAVFIVEAEQGRRVDLNVIVDNLVHPQQEGDRGLGRGKIKLEIAREDCAFSLDNGSTWEQFRSSLHNQKVVIPTDNRTPGNRQILIRVGGTVDIDHNQRRGEYEGRITVSVEYQ